MQTVSCGRHEMASANRKDPAGSGRCWCVREKWVDWILADDGHGPEWAKVLHVEADEWELAWMTLKEAMPYAEPGAAPTPPPTIGAMAATREIAVGGLI